MPKEIISNGIKLIEDEKTGELREPRFDMPIKQALQNKNIRLVYRTGYLQSVLEAYCMDGTQLFAYWRVDNDNEQDIEKLNWVFERFKEQYNITLQDLLPADYQEFKANFYKGIWLKPQETKI